YFLVTLLTPLLQAGLARRTVIEISQQLACERRCRRCILSTLCDTRSASIISPPRRSRPTTKQSRLRQPRCEAWATGLDDLVDTRSTVLFLQWTEPRE